MTNDLAQAAQRYAELGLAVFPLHPIQPDATCACGNGCGQPGKHPITRMWQKTICSLTAAKSVWPPGTRRGIGLLCGPPSDVFAVDVDTRHGGEASLAELELRSGEQLPATWCARTGSGGQHWLYRWPREGPEIRNSAGKLGSGLDVRGVGGYIVLSPSLHVSGHCYTWITSPDECELSDAPKWLVDAVRTATKCSKRPSEPGGMVEGGKRHDALVSLMGLMRSWGAAEEVLVAAAEAFTEHQCEPDPDTPLDQTKALQTARSVARRYAPDPDARTSLRHFV